MKRSRLIKLLLLGTGLVSMTACEDKKNKPLEFKDEQECRQTHTPEECQKAFSESREKHLASAPKFMSKEDCEKQFGKEKCIASPQQGEHAMHGGGHGMFMPMMMGFMMGKMMGGGAAPILPPSQSAAPRKASSWGSSTAQKSTSTPTRRGGFGMGRRGFSARS